MSVKIMSMVWDSPVFRCNTKLIMLCLADFANDEGYCWPSLERISNKCGISRSTLKTQLANLCKDGFIRKELRKKVTSSGELTNDTNVYWIMLDKLGGSESDLGQNSPQPKTGLGRNSSKGRPKSDPKPSIDPSDIKDPPIVPQTGDSEKSSAKQTRKKTKTELPAGFSATPEMHQWYAQQGFSLDILDATNQWSDAMIARGSKYTDWIAAWRNGMRNANKWASERNSKQTSATMQMGASNGNYGPPEGY